MSSWGILSKIFKMPSSTIKVRQLSFCMEFDVVTSENHKWEATTTSNPVETGSQLTDHVQLSPDTLDISGIITNSSLMWLKDNLATIGKALGLHDGESDVQRAFDQLRKLLENRQPVTVYTRYRTYNDMVLTSLSIPRTVENGDSIEFTASFTHIKRVSTLTVNAEDAGINPAETSSKETGRRAESTSNAGNQNSVQVDSSTTSKTETTINNQNNNNVSINTGN